VNAPGLLEIPESVFEELLVNALVPGLSGERTDSSVYLRQPHRDYQPRPSAKQLDGGEDTGDRDGCLFAATVHRKPVGQMELISVVCTENVGKSVGGKRRGK
jgi:hypothetical protein